MLLSLATCAITVASFFDISESATVERRLLNIPAIRTLEKEVDEHKLLNHDLLRCLQDGGFKNNTDAIKTFFSHHYVYSHHFIDYLNKVLNKVDNATISKPIKENIEEENGNYEEEDLLTMKKHKVEPEWFQNIPHKLLSKRFLESVGVNSTHLRNMKADSQEAKNHAGFQFTEYMLNMYDKSNACEAIAVIGFAIEQTVSHLYSFIYDGLARHTDLKPEEYVFFPLHILIDDGHADLLKLAYKHYYETDVTQCTNAAATVHEVLDRRSEMFDKVLQEIEQQQQQKCQLRETTDNAVGMAQIESNAQSKMIENHYQLSNFEKMSYSAKILSTLQGHGDTLSGQISCVNEDDEAMSSFWVTPYGKPLNLVTKDDFLLIDENLNVLGSSTTDDSSLQMLKVNKATRFHMHVYRERPDMKCLIHTHPPHVSALSMTGVPLKPLHMDTMALYDDVQYLNTWPGIPFGSEEGELISGVLGKKSHAALLANHGLIVGGDSIEKATYYAYFFEKAAKMQLDAMAAVGGDISKLPEVDNDVAIKARDWRVKEGPVRSHFYGWVQLMQQTEA